MKRTITRFAIAMAGALAGCGGSGLEQDAGRDLHFSTDGGTGGAIDARQDAAGGRGGAGGAAGGAVDASDGPAGTGGGIVVPDGAVQSDAQKYAFFTNPGLDVQIESATLAADGSLRVQLRIHDGKGVPLDLDGVYTEGKISMGFVAAALAQDALKQPGQYTAYTTGTDTSGGVSQVQAGSDKGGRFSLIDFQAGRYEYLFGTSVKPSNPTQTHTIGLWASRPFQGKTYVANATWNFVPTGGPVTVTRAVVETQACGSCHSPLEAHGGARRDVKLCVLCHTPQSTDAQTGNTLDLRVLIHKIHSGKDLPSVEAGTPYQIVGWGGQVHDFSDVAFPQDLRGCTSCHSGAQAAYFETRPSRAACGSCHDLTSFVDPPPAGKTLHPGGDQPDDVQCALCHPPSQGVAGVLDKHMVPYLDPAATTLELVLEGVTSVAAGQAPQIAFQVKVNGAGRNIQAQPLGKLTVSFAGPTTDYATTWQATVQGSGAAGTLTAIDAAAGRFSYVPAATAAFPASASGTYGIAMEGYLTDAKGNRVAAMNPITYVAFGGATPVPRRTVVDGASCNACHDRVSGHGGTRQNVQYCIFCHNPNATNDKGVARFEGQTVVSHSIDFKVLIHKLHRGTALTQQPYTIGGYPTPTAANPGGTPVDLGKTLFPGDLRRCETCHTAGSYNLPPAYGRLGSTEVTLACTEDPAADTNSYCDTRSVTKTQVTPPASAVCTSCHDADTTVAHTQIMTSGSGVESCSTCHAPGAYIGIDAVHTPDP